MDELDPELLRTAVERRYGARAIPRGAVPVRETVGGELLWAGVVHSFHLTECSAAELAFAWWATGNPPEPPRIHTALGVPPVDSASAAVRAVMFSERLARPATSTAPPHATSAELAAAPPGPTMQRP